MQIKQKKNNDFTKHYHNSDKSKFMPNRLPTGDIGAQFLDLECKRDPEDSLDLWSQNILLYFLLGKGNYTNEEKYIIMINTFIGKVNDWFSGLTEDAEKTIKNDTLEGLKKFVQEGIANLKQYIANEFFGGQGNIKENKEVIRTIAKEQLEKLQICKMSYIQEYTCEFEEYYYKVFDSGKEMIPYLEKYYQKLPGFWAKYFREEYEKENKKGDTLGQRISFLKNRLGQLCMSHNIQRKAKRINTQIYCNDTKASTQWGCDDKPYKKRKQLRKGLIKRKNFSKQNYIPRKKYYKKKKEFSKTKPTDKCKCYNCGEEDHKSYECNKRRVKISKIDRIEIDSDLESIKSIESEDFFDEIYEEYSTSSEESD